MNYPKLYSRDSKGKIRVWWLELENNAYRQHYGVNDGKIVTTGWSYAEIKNGGKTNETTPAEQAKLECDALVVKQLKSNYFENVDDVDKGFLEPQLAKPCKDYIAKVDWSEGQIVDQKLNGIACIITKKNGKVRAVSRKNEEFFAIPHILEDLEGFFKVNPDAYLHGELFNPEYVNELNKIAELVAVTRKEKDITPELLAESKRMVQYHIYDAYGFSSKGLSVNVNSTGGDRRNALICEFFRSPKYNFIKSIEYQTCYSFAEMEIYYKQYVAAGGEGVIIRNPKAPYQHKRTKDLLKYKKSESEEFEVISIEEGEANWAGCAKFVWLKLPKGLKDKKFKSNVKGSQEHLREVLKNKDKYVGKMVTVEFQEYSPYNTPLIPYTDLLVRDYE